MKKQRHIQTTRTLLSRFRYWGRKNYAAFASMGREFQIGHLHTNVWTLPFASRMLHKLSLIIHL